MTESQVYLRDGKSGQLVEASLFDDVTAKHLTLWERTWVPAMRAYCAGRELREKPEDSHWNWRRKSRALGRFLGHQSFALVCREELQGMMMINDLTSARLDGQFGKPLIYVEFVATAPWNRPGLENSPRYRGIGQTFIWRPSNSAGRRDSKAGWACIPCQKLKASTNCAAVSPAWDGTRRTKISPILK